MGQALYRKYRSKSLDEIVGQEHITTTLSNALKQGKISHAYLFTGPRGVGKTSVARILAHEVNGLAYDEEATHLDIIEIDAASNRRIDEIRELREKVHSAPASAKYKVYIIDEVHMLTREAFNALLKTLEEPPAHAIFILATTEAHKVPETITSRTQRFTFRPINVNQQVAHMKTIAKAENVRIDDDALELIANYSGGSFRDSISLLDQARTSADHVTAGTVRSILGIAPAEVIDKLAGFINGGSVAELMEYLDIIRQGGYQPAQLSIQLSERLRRQAVEAADSSEKSKITDLLYKLLGVPASHDPASLLEIILLEATAAHGNEQVAMQAPVAAARSAETKGVNKASGHRPADPPKQTKPEEPIENLSETSEGGGLFNEESWQKVLHAVKSQHNTLYSIARMAVPEFKGGEIILSFGFPFHQKRFNEPSTRQLISDIIYKQTGQKITITCIVSQSRKSSSEPQKKPEAAKDDALANISNIFGDAEVLE